jgi:hypothetical protein
VKRHLIFSIVLLWLVVAWGAGCARGPAATTAPEALPEAVDQETPTLAPTPVPPTEDAMMTTTPTEATEPESAAKTPLPPEAEQVVRLAIEDLVGRLDLAPEAIQLVSVEAVEWPDTSLGCPQPGMMYAQVITPGFLVILEAGGEGYAYHTNRADQVVLCQPQEDGEDAKSPTEAEEAIQLGREDLAHRLGLAPEAIQLVSVEAVEWSDTSLGCPQPGMMYAQVITPGFLVILEGEGERYTYHTDQGRFVVLCLQ